MGPTHFEALRWMRGPVQVDSRKTGIRRGFLSLLLVTSRAWLPLTIGVRATVLNFGKYRGACTSSMPLVRTFLHDAGSKPACARKCEFMAYLND